MKSFYFIFLFLLVLFSACLRNRESYEYKTLKPIQFTYTEKSALYKQSLFTVKLDSMSNNLNIRFTVSDELAKFSFLKSAEGDTLSYTTFSFTLQKNGQPITNSVLMRDSKNGYYNYAPWISGPFVMLTDTFNMKRGVVNYTNFLIPFYALNSLKAGTNQLELLGSQTMFCSDLKRSKTEYTIDASNDTIYRYYRNITKAGLFSFKIRFNIIIPPIYKTTLYGYGITLRNDSVYSPAGMDNTVWNSSYPDIYWSVSYPEGQHYCNSDYQKSTDNYDQLDTFQLFHYYPNDTISISVMDHDNLSRDDGIAYKRFCLSDFPNDRYSKLSYDCIKRFGLKVKHWGMVNKSGK